MKRNKMVTFNGVCMTLAEKVKWMSLRDMNISGIESLLTSDYDRGVPKDLIELQFAAINFVNNSKCWMCVYSVNIEPHSFCPISAFMLPTSNQIRYNFYVKMWNDCHKKGLI